MGLQAIYTYIFKLYTKFARLPGFHICYVINYARTKFFICPHFIMPFFSYSFSQRSFIASMSWCHLLQNHHHKTSFMHVGNMLKTQHTCHLRQDDAAPWRVWLCWNRCKFPLCSLLVLGFITAREDDDDDRLYRDHTAIPLAQRSSFALDRGRDAKRAHRAP